MYCVCGFSAHSGNKLAKHLGTNGCQSVYPSLEEAERARNIPEGEEDNYFIYSRNTEAQEQHEEDKQIPGESGDKLMEDKMDTVEEKQEETEASGEEGIVVEKEEDTKPGPGGLLFGTLFNYMKDKPGGEGKPQKAGDQDTAETGDNQTPVENV